MDLISYQTTALQDTGDGAESLTWTNVALAGLLLLVNVLISSLMKLRLEKQVVIAGVRCFVQLTVLGLVLKRLFATESGLVVVGMSGVLGGLAAFEVSELKAKRTVKGMFWIAFVAIFGSALAVGLLGAAFAMNFKPLLAAPKFIPIIGMLYGNTMVGVALGVDTVLSTADLRRDSVEAMMCYGASRWETVLPIVVDAARTAMLPTITSLSITGLIAIPGMMSGQILGGADVLDAARYQQVIMFMIAACVALGVVFSVIYVAFAVIDSSPKLHAENIHIKAKVDAHNGNKNGKRSNGQGTPTLSGSNNMVHMKAWKSSNVQLA